MTESFKKYLFPLVAFAAIPSFAADVLWTGAGDGTTWSDPNNWDNDGSPGVPLAGDFFNPQGSTISVDGPGATYNTPVISASGTVNIDSGGVLDGTGSNFRVIRYVLFNVNNGGTFNVPFDANIRRSVTIAQGGVFTGADLIQDSAILSIAGEWRPGDSVDGDNPIVASNGDFIMQSTGSLYLDLYGDGVNEHFDTASAGGDVVLNAGSIILEIQGGYTPLPGDSFDLWDNSAGGTVTPGDGSNISLAGFTLDVSTFSVDGIVTVVPEPSTYSVAIAALVGLAVCCRRRH